MINLKKGGKINLQKTKPGLSKLTLGLGWDVNEGASKFQFDCDASVFILGENGKLISDEHFVFYNNKISPDGSVVHNGDNRTGAGDGDDETINIDLTKISSNARQLVFAISIDQAEERGQDFGMISGAVAHVYDNTNNELLIEYNLNEKFAGTDALLIGRIYLMPEGWEFEALSNAYNGGLQTLIDIYC